jgi:Leucine-rich repeat (LRR) protein
VLGQLSNLEWLDLSHNKITSIPEAVGQLSNLKWLDLSHNRINSIPEALALRQLSDQMRLDLSKNKCSDRAAAILDLGRKSEVLRLARSLIGKHFLKRPPTL